MKKLRIFFTKHVISNAGGKHPQYIKTQHQHDFPGNTDPQEAYRKLLKKHGSITDSKETATILTGERILVAPGSFITINSNTYIDPNREKAVIESERIIEQPLFSGTELFAAQSKKPESTYVPRGRK